MRLPSGAKIPAMFASWFEGIFMFSVAMASQSRATAPVILLFLVNRSKIRLGNHVGRVPCSSAETFRGTDAGGLHIGQVSFSKFRDSRCWLDRWAPE